MEAFLEKAREDFIYLPDEGKAISAAGEMIDLQTVSDDTNRRATSRRVK